MNLIETLLQTIITKQDQILAQLNLPTNNSTNRPKCGQNTTKKGAKVLCRYNEQHSTIAKQMYEIINATTKTKKPNIHMWSDEIRKLNVIDGADIYQIMDVFKTANKDDFWSMNIRSPKKLRKHWDRLTLLRNKSLGLNSKKDTRESLDYFKEKQW